ncbi:MAG: hypothetical protein HOE90_16350 [Bacteriovoracaceae bacterium]|jgi:hypothetical protein|nr:hypothetical protein [Bacteriovoracaceae bacterium]
MESNKNILPKNKLNFLATKIVDFCFNEIGDKGFRVLYSEALSRWTLKGKKIETGLSTEEFKILNKKTLLKIYLNLSDDLKSFCQELTLVTRQWNGQISVKDLGKHTLTGTEDINLVLYLISENKKFLSSNIKIKGRYIYFFADDNLKKVSETPKRETVISGAKGENYGLIDLGKGYDAIVDKEDLQNLLQYNWTISTMNIQGNTYKVAFTSMDGKSVYMHRFLLKPEGKQVVAHKDRDGLNNRKKNLFLASRKQTHQRQRLSKGGSSKYKGVSFHKKSKRWQAYITVNGKKLYLGYYKSQDDAAIAYNNAAQEHFGEFVNLNKLD